MLVRVPTIKTNFTVNDFVRTLIGAWNKLYNSFPNKQQIAVLYSQWGVETGIGKYCWNNNISNIKAVDTPGVVIEYCVLNGAWEIINGKKVFLKPENPGSWFRSFRKLEDGMEFYLNFLRNKRYKIAWTAVEQGDYRLFAKLLRQQGYYTASEAAYANAMSYHFNKFMKDNIFENELLIAVNEISFPSDWEPVNFDVKENVFTKPDNPVLPNPPAPKQSIFDVAFSKIRKIINK